MATIRSLKKFKKSGQNKETLSNEIDDKFGAQNICDHFKEQYENLYNEQSNDDELDDIEQQINNGIQQKLN